jgi:hypothetical protein
MILTYIFITFSEFPDNEEGGQETRGIEMRKKKRNEAEIA